MQVPTRMMPTETMHALRFHTSDPAARASIDAAVAAALAEQPVRPRLHLEIDGDGLPTETIATLIAGLRKLREQGGAIEIQPLSGPVRDALSLTGLDRVFAFPLVPDETPRPRRRRGLRRRFAHGIAATFAAALVFAAFPANAQAPTLTDPNALLARVIERNPNLNTFQSRLHVDVKMSSFPFLRQHLDATAYYKKPSNYEVVFDSVPSYAKGFEKLFADVGDPADWQRRFVITYEGQKEFRGRKDVELRLVQRVRGMIDHETVLVDPAGATIDEIRYDYYNGGVITMTQTFTNVSGYTMLASQDADIAIPHVRATAHGEYGSYKTNVALSDAVFTKKN